MEVQLETPKTLVLKQAEVVELSSIVIERVLDDVVNKKVIVWVQGIPNPVELAELSNENYDNPEWSNGSLVTAVTNLINSFQ